MQLKVSILELFSLWKVTKHYLHRQYKWLSAYKSSRAMIASWLKHQWKVPKVHLRMKYPSTELKMTLFCCHCVRKSKIYMLRNLILQSALLNQFTCGFCLNSGWIHQLWPHLHLCSSQQQSILNICCQFVLLLIGIVVFRDKPVRKTEWIWQKLEAYKMITSCRGVSCISTLNNIEDVIKIVIQNGEKNAWNQQRRLLYVTI